MKKLIILFMILLIISVSAFDRKIVLSVLSDTGLGDETIWKEVKALKGHNSTINAVSYSPDGKYLASGSEDGIIKIWDIQSGKELKTFIDSFQNHSIESISYSPDGKYLASGSDYGIINIWDISRGELFKTFMHGYPIKSVFYSPDGEYIVSKGQDNINKFWDISSESELGTIGKIKILKKYKDISSWKENKNLVGTSEFLESVSYSPNGKYFSRSYRLCHTLW